jgi:hypothetical protein
MKLHFWFVKYVKSLLEKLQQFKQETQWKLQLPQHLEACSNWEHFSTAISYIAAENKAVVDLVLTPAFELKSIDVSISISLGTGAGTGA